MTTLPASTIPDEQFRRVIAALVQQWRDQQDRDVPVGD